MLSLLTVVGAVGYLGWWAGWYRQAAVGSLCRVKSEEGVTCKQLQDLRTFTEKVHDLHTFTGKVQTFTEKVHGLRTFTGKAQTFTAKVHNHQERAWFAHWFCCRLRRVEDSRNSSEAPNRVPVMY
ncbi:hypothetical protein, partial [Bosea sp. (in: a-proteobacteria)]|uniref:hypothetical protein n=1 Tax=Bosea sp. (in: a-proteobacteria) TaxID=1871050 RepID=UPI00403342C7